MSAVVGKDRSAVPEGAEGTIQLPAGCKPLGILRSSGTQLRPMLQCAAIRRRGDIVYLVATDSFVATAIPLNVTGDVPDVLVPPVAVRALERGGSRARTLTWRGGAWRWETETARIAVAADTELAGRAWPDLAKLGLWDEVKPNKRKLPPFDARLLNTLALALGCYVAGNDGPVLLAANGPTEPITVWHSRHPMRRGLLMPVAWQDDYATKPAAPSSGPPEAVPSTGQGTSVRTPSPDPSLGNRVERADATGKGGVGAPQLQGERS